MSAKHPIIAVTGSSGAGTTTTSEAFRKMFNMMSIKPAFIEGDSFHRFTRPEMDVEIRKAKEQGKHISYFGPQANDFPALETFFKNYGQNGVGQFRRYLHTFDEAVPYNQMPAHLRRGKTYQKIQTFYSMKGYMVAWLMEQSTRLSMWIC